MRNIIRSTFRSNFFQRRNTRWRKGSRRALVVMAQATPMFEMKMNEEKNLLLACIINNDIRPSRVHIEYYWKYIGMCTMCNPFDAQNSFLFLVIILQWRRHTTDHIFIFALYIFLSHATPFYNYSLARLRLRSPPNFCYISDSTKRIHI